MKEPQRDEEAAEQRAVEQSNLQQEQAVEPRAYAFDGWAMVPLELDPV